MKRTAEIKKTLCVGANVMDANIIKTIVRLFRQKYEKTCDEEDGIIVSIDKMTNLTNVISKDSCHIHFTATFQAQTVKPEKGLVVSFTPTLILPKGIFGKLYDSISLFVPDEYIKGWTFKGDKYVLNESENESTDSENKTITKDHEVKVMIHDIKFNTTKYNCICKLV